MPSSNRNELLKEDRFRQVFVIIFVLVQTLAGGLLYFPQLQPYRVIVRTLPFSLSLLTLGFCFLSQKNFLLHPSSKWLVVVTLYLVLMIFHPFTNTFVCGVGQSALYIAIFSPLFWFMHFARTESDFRLLIKTMLFANIVDSGVGVLQVLYPEQWLPSQLSASLSDKYIAALRYRVGESFILRPPGLSDYPGAVCGSGMWNMITGVFVYVTVGSWKKKVFGLTVFLLGLVVVFLSQVRSSLVMSILIISGMIVFYSYLGYLKRAGSVIIGIFIFALVGFYLSKNLIGNAVEARFSSLVEESPDEVYYSARGHLLAKTEDLLDEFPLGAGLCRWGMLRTYFGDENNLDSPMIWSEIQPTAWALDGGYVLFCAYLGAVLVAFLYGIRIAISHPNRRVQDIAVFATCLNLGTIALMFSYTVFISEMGILFWIINAYLKGISHMGTQQHQVSTPRARYPRGR